MKKYTLYSKKENEFHFFIGEYECGDVVVGLLGWSNKYGVFPKKGFMTADLIEEKWGKVGAYSDRLELAEAIAKAVNEDFEGEMVALPF